MSSTETNKTLTQQLQANAIEVEIDRWSTQKTDEIKIKKTDGKYETFDQNWLMIDPCTTCALGLEGACIPAGEYYATSDNKAINEGKQP